MPEIKLTLADDHLARFGNKIAALGEGRARHALRRAVNHTGGKAKTQVVRTLTRQTGLARKVIIKAVKVTRADYRDTSYTLASRGGDISLKYFRAREIRRGVSAMPFGKRRLFDGAFIRGGRWGMRVPTRLHGHVFMRLGPRRLPIEKIRSGVIIPAEMVKGATLDAFTTVVERDLAMRVGHEIDRMLP